MARLPQVGGDSGSWGEVLNDYVLQSHNEDGTLKAGTVGTDQISDGTITEAKLDGSVRTKLNAGTSGGVQWGEVTGGITDQTDLQTALTAKQDAGDYATTQDLDNGLATKAESSELDAKADSTAVDAAIALKADDATVVHLSDAQTITGAKNFTGGLQATGQNVVITTDTRLTNTRTPTDNTVSTAKIQNGAITAPKISAGGAITGQVLSYDGADLAWTTITPDGTVSDASPSAKGIVQLSGDLAGTAGSPTVAKVNGIAVTGTPATGHVLTATSTSAATWQAGGGGGAVTSEDITDATATGKSVLVASTPADARTAIGAGTSSLILGTTTGTAKAGDYQPTADQVTETTARKMLTAAERTKLTGIATGATVNSTDASLRTRSTHTGTQTASTISDLTERIQDDVAAFVAAGTNVTVSYDDTAGTLTINSSGGGAGAKGDPGDLAPTNGVGTATVWNTAGSPYAGSGFTFPGTYHRVINGNITISSLPAPASSTSGTLSFVFKLSTSAGSTNNITWPSTVYAGTDQDIAMTSTPGHYTIFHLFWTGSKWTLSKQGDFDFAA